MTSIWKKLLRILLITALSVMTGTSNLKAQTGLAEKPRVLFLGSYSYEWESVPKHLAGVSDTLDDYALIDYVFMDTKRLSYEEVKEPVYQQVADRSKNSSFDYVIAADDAALQFVLEYRNDLFAGIPVVFEGINDEDFAKQAASDPLITGIVEVFPLAETIEMASKLMPAATKVVGITDDTVSGQGSTKQFMNCQSAFPNLTFSTLDCSQLTYEEIGNTVASYSMDTILVYLMLTVDADGNTYVHTEATDYVASKASVPVFKTDELGLGNGILGGVMVSFYDMAAQAALIVRQLIQGAAIADFAVTEAPYYCAFDKVVMDRFSISKTAVAAACSAQIKYVNDTPSFFAIHKSVLIPSAIIVLLMAIFGVFSSVTAASKKKLLEQLQGNKHMLESLLENIPGGLAVYKVSGIGQGDIQTVYSSQGIPRLSGRTMEEYEEWIKGGLFDQTVAAEDLPMIKKVLADSIPYKKPFSVQYHLKGKTGRLIPVSLSAEWGGDDKDGCSIYYAVYIDNTIQEKANNAQREAFRAKAANEAKSEFLSRMSHDIRTPLNAVLGFIALAREEKDIPANVTGYLNQIDDAGKYLLGLVNDVLDLSKIESGKLQLHEESVNLAKSVKGAAQFFGTQADKKGIRLTTDFDIAQTPWIMIDELRMRQVYMNLLSNAIKFSAPGTEIVWTLHTSVVRNKTAHMICTVSDQGCGMSKKFMKKMFQPFEQGNPVHADGGTGLGLPIVNSLVTMMGGTITVSSKLNKGSVFTVVLNQRLGQPKTAEAAIRADGSGILKGCQILLCEDNSVNVILTRRQLEKVGCRLEVAENGRIGLEKFAASRLYEYDAILMDIRMPEMDGLAATQAIRALNRPDALTVPIISMSADAFDDDIRKSLMAGMNAHISKPVDVNKLYATLAAAIAKGRDGR